MPELELTRSKEDRRLYALDGVGTLRLEGFTARWATATAGGARWRFIRPRFWRRTIEARDESDAVVGEFEPRAIRRGGPLRWRGRELMLRPASVLSERYALADHDETELAVVEGKAWGRRPVRVLIDEPGALEPGLLLFASFVARTLAEDASSAAGAGAASTAATSG